MIIYLFRHAQTFESKNSIDYGADNFNTPILYEGREPIEKMGEYLKNIPSDFNISSPFLRCKQTVEIITEKTGKEFDFDNKLGEFIDIPYVQFKLRIANFLEEMKSKNYKTILICTHGAVMSVLLHLLLDRIPEKSIPVSEYVKTGVLIKVENQMVEKLDFNN